MLIILGNYVVSFTVVKWVVTQQLVGRALRDDPKNRRGFYSYMKYETYPKTCHKNGYIIKERQAIKWKNTHLEINCDFSNTV